MAGTKAFNLRDLTQHAKAEKGQVTINVKAVPLTATIQSVFTIVGTIEVLSLVAVETIVFSAAEKLSIGFTPTGGSSSPAAIAAQLAAATVGAVGDVFIMPPTLGGVLPVPITATTATTAEAGHFTAKDGDITVTTSAVVTTGTLAWVLCWASLSPKGASVTVVND